MRPGILLDRDGTIIVDYHYVGKVERVQFIPGAADAIARFNKAGIPVAIVTNQGGVARGFYTEEDVQEVHDYIERELALHGAHIDLFLYSPNHPDAFVKQYAVESFGHKPNPGMAIGASNFLNLDLHNSIVVGDRQEDVDLADRIGAHSVYIGATPTRPPGSRPAPFVKFPSLATAAGYIIERITGVSQSSFPDHYYNGILGFHTDYMTELLDVMGSVRQSDIADAMTLITGTQNENGVIFVAGNGGASAIADHFKCDYVKRVGETTDWQLQVFSLTADVPLITAIANDIGYDAIFSHQLDMHPANNDDILIVFSVSGNSANIVRALQYAKENDIQSIAVVAGDGGKAVTIADTIIHIPTSNYGIAEDIMQIIMHSIAQFLRQSRMTEATIKNTRF